MNAPVNNIKCLNMAQQTQAILIVVRARFLNPAMLFFLRVSTEDKTFLLRKSVRNAGGVLLRRAVLTLLPGADFQTISVFFLVKAPPRRRNIGFQNVYIRYMKQIYKLSTKVLIENSQSTL